MLCMLLFQSEELQKSDMAEEIRKRRVQLCYYNLKSNLKYVIRRFCCWMDTLKILKFRKATNFVEIILRYSRMYV